MKLASRVSILFFVVNCLSFAYAEGTKIENIYLVGLVTAGENYALPTGETTTEYVERIFPLLKQATIANRENYEDGIFDGIAIENYDEIRAVWEGLGFSARLTPDALARLKLFPEVKSVENDWVIPSSSFPLPTRPP